MRFAPLILALFLFSQFAQGQNPVIQNVQARKITSLNGNWHYLIDPYETGYRNHRNWTPFDVKDYGKASAKPYYTNKKPDSKSDRVEYDFDLAPTLRVPGDWNHQEDELLYYEGTLWYKTSFQYDLSVDRRLFVHFGGANYEADVYLNGEKLGQHRGGFDPFNFEITDKVKKDNFLIVRVDNRREQNRVPNMTTDWWNYGGITRDVNLVEVPATFISDYHIQLDRNNPDFIEGYIQLNGGKGTVAVKIPELGIDLGFETNEAGRAPVNFKGKDIKKWFPVRPKLYEVLLEYDGHRITDKIGFRTIETKGEDILLNGRPIFLRGISLHEENPIKAGRATSGEEARMLLGWARELNCNFVRLAHYPHNENMARVADEMGMLLWEEIPVYWGIDYENPETYEQAVSQLKGLVHRDKNRASVIIWSMANETPETEERFNFLKDLKSAALEIDPNRLISAALERDERKEVRTITIPDPFAEETDIIGCNEYIGWYGSMPEMCSRVTWDLSSYEKPFFISEFGGGALYNYHGDSLTRWTEEYQEYLYREQLKMLSKIPSLRGMTPWILVDFRSPRRNLPLIQDGWNRKGLISDGGQKKKAFYVLKAFYDEIEKKYAYEIE